MALRGVDFFSVAWNSTPWRGTSTLWRGILRRGIKFHAVGFNSTPWRGLPGRAQKHAKTNYFQYFSISGGGVALNVFPWLGILRSSVKFSVGSVDFCAVA